MLNVVHPASPFMTQHLWYVRRKDVVSGPFPAPQLRQSFSLGELSLRDAVSLDREHWMTVMESGVLDVQVSKSPVGVEQDDEWRREREKARLRWLNDSVEVASDEAPRNDCEVDDRLRRHEQDTRSLLQAESRRRPAFLAGLASLVVIAGIGIAVWVGQSKESTIQTSLAGKASNCQVPAGEGVTWAGCDKSDANLRSANLRNAKLAKARLERVDLSAADLSYANLDGANLRGANLRGAVLRGASLMQADLTGADVSGADFSYAVLTGAYLDGVRLDGASFKQGTWVDGRVCGDDSVGVCQ